jgi:hypothetical protein
MGFLNVITNKPTKNIGIYIYKNKVLYKKITPNSFRLDVNAPFQIADPFLIEFDNQIFCFFEEKSVYRNGEIKVVNITTNEKPQIVELGTNTHLSFPFVFQNEGKYYMIPETNELNEVAIYECQSFPKIWKKKVVLLKGKFVDSSIIEHNGVYFMFTTLKVLNEGRHIYHLEIYYSDTLLGKYVKHASSPIQVGKKFGRLGGSILKDGGDLFRFSQDCEEFYGSELHRFKINKLTKDNIIETLDTERFILKEFGLKLGGHHYSSLIQSMNNSLWEAIDVNEEDNYFQRFLQIIHSKIN